MICRRLSGFLTQCYKLVDQLETVFLRMKNISTMANQIIFLMLADRVLIAEPKMTCLYTLMFYNVITYCVGYIKELIEREDWSPYVTLTDTSKIRHLAMFCYQDSPRMDQSRNLCRNVNVYASRIRFGAEPYAIQVSSSIPTSYAMTNRH